MLIIEFVGAIVFLLALLTIYEICIHHDQIFSLFLEIKSLFNKSKMNTSHVDKVLSDPGSDFNVGYAQGYKAALITAHMDSLEEPDGAVIKEKLEDRLKTISYTREDV